MCQEFFKQFESTRKYLDTLTVGQRNFLFGFINLNIYGLQIDWDLDQTLEITEDPMKFAVDVEHNTKFFERRVDGWDSISKWLTEGGILDVDAAIKYEQTLWTNKDLVMMGPPNKPLRRLSYIANQRGIPQSVTTIRDPSLSEVTYKWLDEYFRWIPKDKINQKMNRRISGHAYKTETILKMYRKNPALIHIDDDFRVVKTLAEVAPDLGVIHIRYPSDDIGSIKYAERRVYLTRDELNSLIYYAPTNEEMASYR